MNKSIKYNDDLEKILTALFGLIGMIAIFINLHLKDYGYENWLGAIKDIAGLIVVLAVFIASVRISSRSKSFTDVARVKLEKLKELNIDLLYGPRYNRENYDPEKGQGKEYLFITNEKKESSKRAKFIPVQPLEEGILTIYIQKGTLVYGLNYTSEQATQNEIKKIQDEVHKKVSSLIQKKYSGLYEILPNKKEDTAIIIDFDENEMGKSKFGKAIYDSVECAIFKINELKNVL